MDNEQLLSWASRLVAGEVTPESFRQQLDWLQAATIGELPDATVDLDRQRRCGFPEVVYAAHKSVESLTGIFQRLQGAHQPVLATRVDSQKAAELGRLFPQANYNPVAGTFRIDDNSETATEDTRNGISMGQEAAVVIVTAGTSDLPVAEEARETLDWMGLPTTMIHDVGVAGPHRLPVHLETLRSANVIIVVAGMEGALPSVVGGYVAVPVIAVPTSVGYGTAFGGVTALLGMLNSCAANVTVVNIDAGFKAGYVAGLIAAGANPGQPRSGGM